ncbi:MAG: DUF4097 family beta strand repeat-containing protein, partial [Clostridiales bacterium]|nr:DUF4097 family beta strand repeat-containing protein [Clostridiales bacterium]
MKKNDFLTELSNSLANLDPGLRDEICGDFADHFTEGAERGLSEEDICRNLGQPASIAEQFLNEYGASASDRGVSPSGSGRETGGCAAETTDHSPAYNGPPPAAVPPASGARPARQKGSSGFGFGNPPYEINIEKTFTDIRNIHIDLINSNLLFEPSSQSGSVSVSVKGYARHDRFTVESRDGQLTVTENGTRFFLGFIFSLSVKLETVIRVPLDFSGSIFAKVSNGATQARDVHGERLQIKNSARNVRIDSCGFSAFDVHVSAGSLEYTNNGAHNANLHATAGNLSVDNATGAIDADCTAGDLRISRHEGSLLKARAAAGNILISECAAELDIHAAAGDVKIQCAGKVLQSVKAHSSAGNVKLYAEEADSLNLTSAAGNVKVSARKIGGARLSSNAGNVKAEAWEVDGNVDAHSSMGNVHLYLPDDVNCRI